MANAEKAKQLSFLKRHAYDVNFQIDPSRYRLGEKLGSGAFGIVCAASAIPTGERVAIKKIPEALGSPIVTKRTYREICILRHFAHPNIINFRSLLMPYGVSQQDARDLYVVYDFMATDLHRIITSTQQLGEDHVRYLVYQLFCGLKYIHSADVIHRDLKPANLLVNADCQLKIGDFGMSRALSDTADVNTRYKLTQYVMTRWYRAPELLMGQLAYCTAVDIWSCGCILAELLTRQPLFPGTNEVDQFSRVVDCMGTPPEPFMEKILPYFMKAMIRSYGVKQPKPLSQLVPQGSRKALDLLSQLLVYEPEHRITATKALAHPFLNKYRKPNREPTCPTKLDFSFDEDLTGRDSTLRYRMALIREVQSVQQPHLSDHDYSQLEPQGLAEVKRELTPCDSSGSEPPLIQGDPGASKQVGSTLVRVIEEQSPRENDVAMVSAPHSAVAGPSKPDSSGRDPMTRAALAAGLADLTMEQLAQTLAPLFANSKSCAKSASTGKRKGGTNWPPQKTKKKISAETNRQLKQLLRAKSEVCGAGEPSDKKTRAASAAQRRRERRAQKKNVRTKAKTPEVPAEAPDVGVYSEENQRLLQRWEDLRTKYKGPEDASQLPPDLSSPSAPSTSNIHLPPPILAKNPTSADSLEKLLADSPDPVADILHQQQQQHQQLPVMDVAVLAANGEDDVGIEALSAHLDSALHLFEEPPPPPVQTPKGSGTAYGINCDLQELVNGEVSSFVAQLTSPDHADTEGGENDLMEVWQQLCPVDFEVLFGDLGFPQTPHVSDAVEFLSPK